MDGRVGSSVLGKTREARPVEGRRQTAQSNRAETGSLHPQHLRVSADRQGHSLFATDPWDRVDPCLHQAAKTGARLRTCTAFGSARELYLRLQPPELLRSV